MTIYYFIFPFEFNGDAFLAQLTPTLQRFRWFICDGDMETIKDNGVVDYFNNTYLKREDAVTSPA